MKILITISGDHISPRLDMTREILLVTTSKGKVVEKPRTVLLDKTSAEDLCSYIIKEDIASIICGGIEEKHYKYLKWKKTTVIDSVIGPYQEALELFLQGKLKKQAILTAGNSNKGSND